MTTRIWLTSLLLSAALPHPVAFAATDPYTGWLAAQPMTRLDWGVMNLTAVIDRELVHPDLSDRYATAAGFDAFKEALSSKHVSIERTFASYDFDADQIRLTVVGASDREPDANDCKALLDSVRDRLLSGFSASATQRYWSAEDRKKYAAYFISEAFLTPSKVGPGSEPKDMAEHLADLTTVRAIVEKPDDYRSALQCNGSFAGTDANLKLK